MRWFFPVALVLVLSTAAALFALAGDDSSPTPEPTLSGVAWTRPTPSTSGEAGYVPTSPQIPTPTPIETPEASPPFPLAQWTEIDPLDTMDAGTGDYFLLDTQTGKMYSPVAELPDQRTQISIGWLPDGQTVVGMYGGDREYPDDSSVYAGDLFGEMFRLPGRYIRISSKGIGAYDTDDGTFLYDVAARRDLGAIANRPLGNVGGWSADGRYLVFRSGNSLLDQPTTTAIWDSETSRVVAELSASFSTWSNTGAKLLYHRVDPKDEDERVIESRLLDTTTGQDIRLSEDPIGYWSPDDRYVFGGGAYIPDSRRHAVVFYGASNGRPVLTLEGSWPMAWTGPETIGFMGGVCGPSSFYTVNIDGTNLRRLWDFDWARVAHPSPNGAQLAFTTRDEYEQPTITTVVDSTTGVTREFVTGGVALPPFAYSQPWSADGRYLTLYNPGGRDGPCFETAAQPFQLIRHP